MSDDLIRELLELGVDLSEVRRMSAKERARTIEEKSRRGIVRHIETPEGARKYGGNIGDIIEVDEHGNLIPRKAPGKKPPAKAPVRRSAAASTGGGGGGRKKPPAARTGGSGQPPEKKPAKKAEALPKPPKGAAPKIALNKKADDSYQIGDKTYDEWWVSVQGVGDFVVVGEDNNTFYAIHDDDKETPTDGKKYKTKEAAAAALEAFIAKPEEAKPSKVAATASRARATAKGKAPRTTSGSGDAAKKKQDNRAAKKAAAPKVADDKIVIAGKKYSRGTMLQDPPPPAKRPLREKKDWRPATQKEIDLLVSMYGKSVKPPPGWTNIQVNPLALTGDDDSAVLKGISQDGKWKTAYTPHHWGRQNPAKFDRVRELAQRAPELAARVDRDALKNESAAMLSLALHMGLRPDTSGDEVLSTKGHQGYGASTLEARHVVDAKGNPWKTGPMFLKFAPGKKAGVEITLPVDHPLVKKVITQAIKGKSGPQKLFGPRAQRDADSYLKSALPVPSGQQPFLVKDLRTMVGTATAIRRLNEMKADGSLGDPLLMSRSERNKVVNAVADYVASILGNTRTVAKGSYIDPTVLEDLL